MSPSKRTDKRARRRRAWAAPFVMTAALAAPGCVVKEAPPPQHAQPAQQGPTTVDHRQPPPAEQTGEQSAPPKVIANPPPPAQTTDSEQKEPPKVIVNPPPPGAAAALPDAPDGGTVQKRNDGTCWWTPTVTCPPKATCNPPPPRQVKCK